MSGYRDEFDIVSEILDAYLNRGTIADINRQLGMHYNKVRAVTRRLVDSGYLRERGGAFYITTPAGLKFAKSIRRYTDSRPYHL